MKLKQSLVSVAVLCSLFSSSIAAFAQGTTFTYQGRLNDNGSPANGTYDFRFRLASDSLGTTLISSPVLVDAQFVSNGLFTAALDFGPVFTGSNYWLQVDVKTNMGGSYTTLTPLQPVTPAPYAMMANLASNLLGTLPAAQLTGTVGNSQLANDSVTSDKIVDGTITAADLAPNSVNSGHIIDGQVQNADLGNNAVTTGKILDGTILGTDMANNTVGSDQLADTIALGKSNVVGRLDVFYANTASNQPAISLMGSGSQISTYGSDGQEQIRLWGQSWGEMYLYDNSAENYLTVQASAYELFSPGGALRLKLGTTNRVYIKGGTSGGTMTLYANDGGTGIYLDGDSGGAGYMDLRSTNGSARVILDGDTGTGAGFIGLRSGSGTETVQTLGAYGSALGGDIKLRQNDSSIGVEMTAEQYAGDGGIISIKDASGSERIELDGDDGDGAAAVRIHNAAGSTTITLDGQDSTGNGRVTTQVLQITGGSDLSEQFDVNAAPETLLPGTVVSIDPEHPGQLRPSTAAYDRTVAGVISGAGGVKTGLLMGQHGTAADGKHPIALSGRVYVRADASTGAIVPGDLLTTSAIPGHAMKVTDHVRAQGAILGKAMTALDEGTGMVLVLVSLQ